MLDRPESIRDEYGDSVDLDELRQTVTGRRGRVPRGLGLSADWYSENCAEPGPFGLARTRVDGQRCVGHGAGTWDLIAGEFS